MKRVDPVKPEYNLEELNKLTVLLPELRMILVELMKEGISEYPLGDLLLMMRQTLKGQLDDAPGS